eukprot:15347859-Ditylum_brightwellii.AAC.1
MLASPLVRAIAPSTIVATSSSVMDLVAPSSMSLEFGVESMDLSKGNFTPIEISTDSITNKPSISTSASCLSSTNLIQSHTGKFGSEGNTFSDLTALSPNPLDGFGAFGVVKETGVDNEGLMEFQTQYFPHLLYQDEELLFYEALRSRKLKLTTWNPIRMYQAMKEWGRRLEEKGIEGNYKGKGRQGKPRYNYLEKTGEELPADDIVVALNAARD